LVWQAPLYLGAWAGHVPAPPVHVHLDTLLLQLGHQHLPPTGSVAIRHEPGGHLGLPGRQVPMAFAKLFDVLRQFFSLWMVFQLRVNKN
jgi:hypothetical protein